MTTAKVRNTEPEPAIAAKVAQPANPFDHPYKIDQEPRAKVAQRIGPLTYEHGLEAQLRHEKIVTDLLAALHGDKRSLTEIIAAIKAS